MSNKRERGSDSPVSNGSSTHLPSLNPDGSRPIAGRRSIGMGNIPQAPSPSDVAGVGGLPYDTEHLARANPDMIPGMQGHGNMEMQWMQHGGSAASGQQQLFGPGTAGANGPNAMPNLNIFDLFQTEQQLFNVPMMGQGPAGAEGSTFNGGSRGAMQQEGGGYAPQMDSAAMASMNEALQMWSSAPTSFE